MAETELEPCPPHRPSYMSILKRICLWLPWGLIAACGLSLVVGSRGSSLVMARGLLTALVSLAAERGLQGERVQ